MHAVDYVIVAVYLTAMVVVGLWMQRKAKKGIESYFLGDRNLPWWALGASGMSSNLDISGTMIIVALVYAIGAKGFYIEIRGGVTLIMAFLMIYMGKWNRRSKVMTVAEWMSLRFGKGPQGDVARLIQAITSIIFTIAMITYFAIGGGKFLDSFLGIPKSWTLHIGSIVIGTEFWAAFILIAIAMIYTVASGLYGVIWTDVFQGILIFLAIAYVVVRALGLELPEAFAVGMPLKDGGFMQVQTTLREWVSLAPQWRLNIPAESDYSMYNVFGVLVMFYLFKVILEGSGGTGNYMIQRYYAARNDREAGLLSLFWTGLLSFRWPFIAALAVWGISLGTSISDPEMVLPAVVTVLPAGIKGFIIAGLMAAAMSTFDSTVNAGAAYWVKDIYQQYINPKATDKQLMKHSYGASILIVVLGLALTVFIKNINEIWSWITMGLGAGLLIPQLVRWYWHRLNGYGYAIGIGAGMLTAILWKVFMKTGLLPDALTPEYYAFAAASLMSLLGIIIGTLATRPIDEKVTANFYNITRPFGAWKKYREMLPEPVRIGIKKENTRDIISVFLAVPWQLSLFMFMMNLVFKAWSQALVLGLVFLALSTGLYFTWFRHLSTEVKVGNENA
ncbi:MAG: sodium:solute symporter [Candidatus Neomarinimicrobiota bacterium]